jgi:mannose-6-phosphate isomerase-like protein (cupin superfamily)
MYEITDAREIIKTARKEFGEYDFIDPIPKDIGFMKLSYDKASAQGAYMMRMAPGATTERHVHKRREEYYIVAGDLIESDGTVLGPGDFVIYPPGSTHNSRTETGCLILAIDYSWSNES